jgi:hypothetical protein
MCAVNGILRTAVVGVREYVDVVEYVIGCGVVVSLISTLRHSLAGGTVTVL